MTPQEELFITPREQRSNFGLAIWHARPRRMPECHHHNDIEVNFLERGSFIYLSGGKLIPVNKGDLCLFWAARPHQVVALRGKPFFWGLSIPLSWFLEWELPDTIKGAVLQGKLIFPQADKVRADFARVSERWLHDLQLDSGEHRRVMLLEIECWFRRVALGLEERNHDQEVLGKTEQTEEGLDKVEQMARYIDEHYREDLTTVRVAQAVGLHPNYAVNLFRKKTGSTLIDFIVKQRLGYAQLLLATTDIKVRQIAQEAGFGSPSRFYAVFKSSLNMTPRDYRAMLSSSRP